MSDKFSIVIGLGGCIAGLIGIGYAIDTHKKMNDICDRLDVSIDEISKGITVDIPDYMVNKAVEKTVEREVSQAVRHAVNDTMTSVKTDIHNEVETAVRKNYCNIKETVTETIAQRVSMIDMNDLSSTVTKKAEQKIVEKFDDNLDELLKKFNHNLDNMSKVYGTMAAMSIKQNDGKMTFTIS